MVVCEPSLVADTVQQPASQLDGRLGVVGCAPLTSGIWGFSRRIAGMFLKMQVRGGTINFVKGYTRW